MKVTGWTNWDNEDYEELPNKMCIEATIVVADEVKKKGYKFCGKAHQYNDNCTPIIDNKYRYNVSCRMWGEIMAYAYDLYEDENDAYAYALWAWTPRIIGEDKEGNIICVEEVYPD